MTNQDEKNWQTEFEEFLGSDADHLEIPKTLFEKVKNRLFPNPWIVFSKVALVHAILGFVSLSICNQFGLNPFRTSFSLSDWFMKMGSHHLCMSLCGIFFMASTYVLSNMFLTLEELESFKRHEWLQTGIFSLVSLAAFYFFGAELVTTVTILWLIGAFIGGVLSIESSYYLRRAWSL